MPQFQWARIAALAAAFVLGGVGVGAVGQQLEEPQDEAAAAGATASTESTAHPFLQDTVTFRSSPDAWSLLRGGDVEAAGVGLLNRPCTTSSAQETTDGAAAADLPVPPVRVLAVPDKASSTPRDVEITVPDAAAVAGDDVLALPACPLHLTVTVGVDHPQGGALVTAEGASDPQAEEEPAEATAATAGRATTEVLVPYTLTHYISPSGYWLLGLSSLAVGLVGLLPAIQGNFAGRVTKKQDQPSYPVMAGLAAALTAVSGGTIAWSDFAPTLNLVGVTVILLVAGAFVTMGETLVKESKTVRTWTGHLFRVFGTATLALLPAFVLFHGANIGGASVGVWIGLVALLCWVAVLIVPAEA